MTKKVLIIHFSSIIAEGIGAILQKQFNVTCSVIQSFSDQYWTNNEPWDLIICDTRMVRQVIAMKNQFEMVRKTILIGLDNEKNQKLNFAFDTSFDISFTETEIYEFFSKYLKKEDKRESNREGFQLSVREQEVLKLVATGFSNKKIAENLFISVHTVISHRKNISEKTGIKSVSGLTIYAILNKMIDPKYLSPDTFR